MVPIAGGDAPGGRGLAGVAHVAAVNIAVLVALLVVVEAIFGNWLRPLTLGDLKRFSIPVGVTYTFDSTAIYEGGPSPATYTRDRWGLRGTTDVLERIDVVTVGGSTTDQRNLDDRQTWQVVAERELQARARPLVFANAGVDGQSTVGHAFNFRYWFPLLEGLRPRLVLFYVGINDVLMSDGREAYDRSVDASTWRTRSALYQLYRLLRGNLRARAVGATHGRGVLPDASEFTDQGLLTDAERQALAREVTAAFLSRVDGLARDTLAWGAVPLFVTQTAYGWNAGNGPPRGRRDTVRAHGRTLNFADIAYLHQHLNRGLLAHCTSAGLRCIDLAGEVAFEAADYYDTLHNTPAGAAKIGRYLAERLATLAPGQRPDRR